MASVQSSSNGAKDLTREEVAKNNSLESLWVIVDHRVYDLTDFADAHPGGSVVLAQVAGQDATEAFYNLHRHEVIEQYEPKLSIGTIKGEKPEVVDRKPGELSAVPYAEPLWLSSTFKSPYYSESHHNLRRALREFVEKYIKPEAQQKELDGTYVSKELHKRMADANIIHMRIGPGKHMNGRTMLGGVKGEDFDAFHDLIVAQEIVRANARGFQDGNLAGTMISLTAVQRWMGNEKLKDRVTNEVLAAEATICLAVTEAFAGSDVAGLRTTCTKSADGKKFIINGTKKWITNGMFANYFVVACKSEKGYTVVLVPRQEGVETSKIKMAYSPAAATTFIEFDNVEVPVDHLLGEEHNGFTVVMSNFNHERWAMVCMLVQWCRTVTEECLKWSNQRIVQGKKLHHQQIIRSKLAAMISRVEALQAWLEAITAQMNQMDYKTQSKYLGGQIGLLKSFSTRMAHDIADDAVNIFGGRGLTQTGMGRIVEQFHRTYKFDAILGGSEEVLSDLGVRQALRNMPKAML